MRLSESAYEWAKIPVDLPRENLVLITAKTTLPTIHKSDPEYPVRLFNPNELHESARSLAKRPMGVNHIRRSNPIGYQYLPSFFQDPRLIEADGLIDGAFTVDTQWNPSTQSIEALVFLPTQYITNIRRAESEGIPIKYSVEYTWRDERKTESGVEFIGLCFDRVDIICGLPAGDKATSYRLVEADMDIRKGLMEAEEVQIPEGTNTMTTGADVIQTPVELPLSPQPHENVTTIGAIPDNMGNPTGLIPAVGNPDKNLNSEPAKECSDKKLTESKESELERGEDVEMEHSATIEYIKAHPDIPTKEAAELIAKDHIKELSDYYTRLDKMEEEAKEGKKGKESADNPIIEDSKVLAPDKSNQSVEDVNQEEKKLKESVEPTTPSVTTEPVKQPDIPTVPPTPPVPDPKDKQIKDLTDAVTRLQANVTQRDSDKQKAIVDAEKRGKEAVISKIREVIPVSGFFGGNIAVTATKRVIDDVNRKLRECQEG